MTTEQKANVLGLLAEFDWDVWAGKVLTAPNDFCLQAESNAEVAGLDKIYVHKTGMRADPQEYTHRHEGS